MALIPQFFLDCVVSIGVQQPIIYQNAFPPPISWIGTGFLVGRHIEGTATPKKYFTYLVTNKHVIQNQQSIVVRFNSLLGNETKDYPCALYENLNQNWIGHTDPNVDVAAIPVNPEILTSDNAKFHFFSLDDHSINATSMKQNGFSEGDFLYILGFPMGIVTNQQNCVIARSGIIARIRDVFAGASSTFLIDANIYPGNSGGPVISKPEAVSIEGTSSISHASLIGMVKSYLPYRDTAISQQTGNPRVIFEENSGLAAVETVDNIISTIDMAYNKFNAPTMLSI
ncbi:S1 family peptidase [Aeromonas salmonicida]|uniref:S1 family peptidase n=1 Tax=Aeromonas salmonicida TaxID=645 RepID=UPI000F7AF3C4|nr:serine protease [Aeromonas salmonicida]RSM33197.1 hypothetical protein C5B77_03745 [Aeromonas salmonicida]